MKKKFWIVNRVNAIKGEILFYGYIGQYEQIDDAAFVNDLRTLEAQFANIDIRVNCGGGDVYKGLAIFNAIRNSKANIETYIDGIAASMGAVICAASPKVYVSKYARYMTHRVSGGSWGNADDMRACADELENLEDIISEVLAKRTGLDKEAAKAKYITNKDRWINAEQALSEKLVDGIYDAEPVELPTNAAELNELQIFNAYNRVYNLSQNVENMKAIALLLGLPENATETEITAKISELKAAKENAENAAKQAAKAKAQTLVNMAIQNKQLTEADRQDFEALAESNYETAVKAINRIPRAAKPTDVINRAPQNITGENADDGEDTEDAEGDVKKWDALVKKGVAAVNALKQENFGEYARLYKAKYGRDL